MDKVYNRKTHDAQPPGLIGQLLGYYQFLVFTIGHISILGRKPMRTVLFRQIYFGGIEAMGKFALIAAFVGCVIITQLTNMLGLNAVLIGKILLWTVIRELGPLFAAILVISRSCAAVTSELAAMKINGEIEVLKLLGINPLEYLVAPRVAGIIVSLFLLTAYLQMAAIVGGLLLATALIDMSFLWSLNAILGSVSLSDIAQSLVKSLVFGTIISVVACFHGMSVHGSITEIPKSTIKSVMRCLTLVFLANGFITYMAYL